MHCSELVYDAPDLLRAFLKKNGLRPVAVAKALGVSSASVHDWLYREKRPTPDHRGALEVWTHGDVPAVSWKTKEERAGVVAVRPFDPAESGVLPTQPIDADGTND